MKDAENRHDPVLKWLIRLNTIGRRLHRVPGLPREYGERLGLPRFRVRQRDMAPVLVAVCATARGRGPWSHRLPHLQEASRKAAKAQRKQENSNG